MFNHKRSQYACIVVAALGAASPIQAASLEVILNTSTRYQTIDGWGTCNTPNISTQAGLQAAQDYAALGCNLVRVYANKNVLVTSPTDYLTPIPLTTNMASNIAKMNFSTGGMDPAGNFSKWLTTNALYPSRVKISTDMWTPPAWMKGPDQFTADWIGNSHTANSLNGVKFATPWLSNQHNINDPTPTNSGDSIGGRLVTEDANNLQQYGYYMASWVAGFQQQYGVAVYSVNIQNESTYENDFDSMTLVKDADGTIDYTQYALALESVKQAWSTFGMTAKVIGPGTARVGDTPDNPSLLNDTMNMIQAVKNFSGDSSLKNFLGIYGTNFYLGANENSVKMLTAYWQGKQNVSGTTFASYLLAPGIQNDGKPVWFTENGDGGPGWTSNTDGSPGAIKVALNIYNALVYANASAYEYWAYVASGTTADTYSLLGTGDINTPTNSKKYDAFKQMSRYILPGSHRISATFKSTGTGVSSTDQYNSITSCDVTAFIDDPDKMITVVLLNMQTSSNTITLDIPANLLNGSMQVFVTDGASDNFTQLANLTAVNNKVTFTMQGSSVYTLVGATLVPEPAAISLLSLGAVTLLRRRPKQLRSNSSRFSH